MTEDSIKSNSGKEYKRFIDIEKAIGAKNPRLLKMKPRFLLNYIKRVIHQKELNDAVNAHSHRYRLDFADAAMEVFGRVQKFRERKISAVFKNEWFHDLIVFVTI